jgi:hypothetical protein
LTLLLILIVALQPMRRGFVRGVVRGAWWCSAAGDEARGCGLSIQ